MIEVTSKGKIVTLVGPMVDFQTMMNLGSIMSQYGNIVLHPFKDPREKIDEMTAQMYDEKIRLMMDMSCSITPVILNFDFYEIPKAKELLKSTTSEVQYAFDHGYEVKVPIMDRRAFKQVCNEFSSYDPIRTITICGSRRFIDNFKIVFDELTYEGFTVFTPAAFEFNPERLGEKILSENLDKIHQHKMMMSDAIYVVNPDGYIGDDTKEEIKFALGNRIPVIMHDTNYIDLRTLISQLAAL